MANPVGRPPRFKNVQELEDLIFEWKEGFKIGSLYFGEVPDVEHFCDHAGVWRDLLIEYEKKPEFSDTIKQLKNYMYKRKKQLAMAGKMNATVYIFDAKNNHGYVDKQEIDQNISGELKNGDANPKLAAEFAAFLKSKD